MPRRPAKFASLAAAVLAASCAAATSVAAESIEKSFIDFEALNHKYEQQRKQQIEEGYVLENLKDKSGRKTGTLSFGGASDVKDPYQQFGADTNYRGRTINEIDGPKLNLRLSF